MAGKIKEQLEDELAQALATIATMQADKAKLDADISDRDAKISELEKALADAGKAKPPAPASPASPEGIARHDIMSTRKAAPPQGITEAMIATKIKESAHQLTRADAIRILTQHASTAPKGKDGK